MIKVPSVESLQEHGTFLGYDQYDEVYQLKDKKWVILDYIHNNEVRLKVVRWYGKKNSLVKGYNEHTGDPL